MPKIAYLGPEGTFSHEAVERYAKDKEGYSLLYYNTMPEVLLSVQNGAVDQAIVPIENSLEGAVNTTMDMLAGDVDLKIIGEVVVPIRQNLLVKKGVELKDIRTVLSHPQPIGQCRKYIDSTLPEAIVKFVYSTAEAAIEVAQGGNNSAAVGSSAAARVYGLEILEGDIQDGDNNMTRFVVLSKQESQRTGSDKTSIVFSFSSADKPGSLYRILDIFNLWDINMTRIESRPTKNQLGSYLFFVDINGHQEDEDVRDALTMVKRKTSFYKFLGSYPEFKGNWH